MSKNIITILLLIALILTITYFVYFAYLLKTVAASIEVIKEIDTNIEIINGAFFKGQVGYYSKYQDNWLLINCLIWYESRGNPKAVGEAGEIGILQFMPTTFQQFCVEKYGYKDDIYNSNIQKDCAAEMIEKGGITHWTTKKFCLKVVK